MIVFGVTSKVCAALDAPLNEPSMDCLSGKMHALECKVTDFPTRFEMLEKRTDLLEKADFILSPDYFGTDIIQKHTNSSQVGVHGV